ncbi:hypothetical protein [Acanthopleuribacter pedis]|uniref:Uncharacterized protein n=1 Tax=Acanthopleuribacter pedis TaxID=442870 RepID=A0A8J7U6T4_9BACT|nr:hypothetical protein [Acanthopleuribacter pedis]MBO1320706.1 hypothetical protein [Acanthopleuribacter pedis]
MREFGIPGAPDHELNRGPASQAIGQAAAASHLLLAHYEYRHVLQAPEHWLPQNRPDLAGERAWSAGILPENKYSSFRNDLMLGSFHPNHRAKWTAHELCHGLVGFAWKPDASLLFHATAARLSELLPVALFYFLDEVHLNRCPEHQFGGPLFGTFCAACELAAAKGPRAPRDGDARWLADGLDFVQRELDAVARTIETGRPLARPWANLDLCSDGLAYAAAQQRRLNSPVFAQYIEAFFPEQCGHHKDLQGLIDRIAEVSAALTGGAAPTPWRADRALWQSQDIGWRFLELAEDCDSDIAVQLKQAAWRLAESPDDQGLETAIDTYLALNEEFYLPEPESFFGVGYALPKGFGFDLTQIAAGLQSACPRTWELLDQERVAHAFAAADAPQRHPLGLRFAEWLAASNHEHAELAVVEAWCSHAPAADPRVLSLAGPPPAKAQFVLAPDARLIDVAQPLKKQLGLTELSLPANLPPALLAVRRDASGQVLLSECDPGPAAALRRLREGAADQAQLGLDDEHLQALIEACLITPTRWTV